MTTIGILSDTHIRPGGRRQLPPQVFTAFEGVDLIFHAGDLNTLQVVTDLENIAPVLAVPGNNDDWDVMSALPPTRTVEIERCIIGLAHGDRPNPEAHTKARDTAECALSHFRGVDCVVFGHSHWPLIHWRRLPGIGRTERDGMVLLFNPGSPTDRRRAPHFSCGLLRVDGRHIDASLTTW